MGKLRGSDENLWDSMRMGFGERGGVDGGNKKRKGKYYLLLKV
jgi:hypothetical protein